ncbi:MAG TPA: DUF2231 domain-containing protein [Candidatus Acidoferrum sp.]|nr:DUF2231 domain-containing protein [Candidatus Acidoferrum sp.]
MTSLSKVFDPQTVLLAKHAQHVVLVHFPIGLFLTGVAFDWAARWTRRQSLSEAAYYNLLVAAASTIPVVVTGLLAWQFQLEGQRLKGILLLHLLLGSASGLLIWTVWWLHFKARRQATAMSSFLWVLEAFGVLVVGLTGHLGGFLAGVNG